MGMRWDLGLRGHYASDEEVWPCHAQKAKSRRGIQKAISFLLERLVTASLPKAVLVEM